MVLACSDHRYQEPLRDLLAAEGLLGGAETILWPGGSSALAGPEGGAIMTAMTVAAAGLRPRRLVLVAHQGCRVPGAHLQPGMDPFAVRRVVAERRQFAVERAQTLFAVEPELWFLTHRGARRVRSPFLTPPSLVSVP